MDLFGRLFRRKKRHIPSPIAWEPTPSQFQRVYTDVDGRRYRGDALYLLPKDGLALQRLDYQHFILRHVLQGNCYAPVHSILDKGGHVLDVGCGTGRWGRELAARYPKTQIFGFDLDDIPRPSSTPLNYQFSSGNLLDGLPFTAQSFQYVHQRLLAAAIPLDAWPVVIKELKRVTAPGGWIELVEMGSTFHHTGPATQLFLTWWVTIAMSKGIDVSKMSQIGAFLKQAGIFNIKVETKILSVGSWGGRLGNLLAQDVLAGWSAIRPLAQSMLGISPGQFNMVMSSLPDEWNTYLTTYEVYFACGQV